MRQWKAIALAAAVAFSAIFVVASGSHGALYQWSKTANSNATADATINWSEGMSPSSVNDSARALMARVAEWRDDLSGLLATAGTATAYTLTSNQSLPSVPTDGQAIAFTVHATSGAAPTLQVDSGTVYPIHSAAGTAVPTGILISGAPYTVKFKLASTAWVLHGFYGTPAIEVPVGAVIDYLGTTAPSSNFVLPSGQCISRTTYSVFFTLVGTRYGVCDGVTTFAVPDMRGTILAGLDNMGGVARGLLTTAGATCDGVTIGTQCGAQNVTLTTPNLPPYTPAGLVALTPSSIATTNNVALDIGAQDGAATSAGDQTQTAAFTGTPQGGTSVAVNKLPPLQIVTKILRIF